MRLRELIIVATFALAVNACAAEISGTVRLAGAPPRLAASYPDHDTEVCGSQPRESFSLVLGSNQAVRNVIVYLDAARNGLAATGDPAPIALDQRECEFVPRVQIARSGAPLILKNSDPVLHVVRIDSLGGTNGSRKLLEVAAPYAGFVRKFQLANFKEATLLKASNLNGHAWMSAYIAVLPHPWAALTDENGNYTLRGVPAGAFKICAWHEVLGTLAREVHASSDKPTKFDIEFTAAPSR